ncbi:hypothetical protein [Hydrogenophaga sp. 2FB]|uniref:hypothetical protein n=1 Tax=Hydrogenophaga sp. 2FB TaxID=2502187 RepID=UPI00148500AA|nr:hypothetical protein [Hydrogenophaga sp. 2FB]
MSQINAEEVHAEVGGAKSSLDRAATDLKVRDFSGCTALVIDPMQMSRGILTT